MKTRRCLNLKCSELLVPAATGRPKRFCSGRCQVAHWRRVHRKMARNRWFTPPEVIDAARRTMGGIDLDPASELEANEIVRAERFYTEHDDGMRQPWWGRVWLNPPYGRSYPRAQHFVERFAEMFEGGAVEQGCILLKAEYTTANWFHATIYRLPHRTFTSRGRMQFSGTRNCRHGSIIVGVGVDRDRFASAFLPLGGRIT